MPVCARARIVPPFSLLVTVVGDWAKGGVGNLVILVIDLVTQERRMIVNPNREKQRGITQNDLREYPIPRKTRVGTKRK